MSSLIRSLAVSVLSRYLGEYVESGLDSEHMEISLSSGDATLEQLELRASALDSLDLPITVRAGFLEKVKINIPWTSIKSQPASIEIQGLFLLAGPRKVSGGEYDLRSEMQRAQSNKQKRLVIAEMLRGGSDAKDSAAASAAAAGKEDGFTARLIALVLNNLQVKVRHVHIRYEDDHTNPTRPFVCGLTLESFSGVTVDEQGNPAFIVEPKGFIHKFVELRNFAVYWDSHGEHLEFQSGQEMRSAMNDLIWKEGQSSSPRLTYLLMPVSGSLKLAMLRDAHVTDFSRPQYLFEFLFENIRVMLHESQYKDFASLAEGFRLQSLRENYLTLQRPSLRPKQDPRGWWAFAGRCVQHDLREQRAQWSWARILQRKRDRSRYILLYAQAKREHAAVSSFPDLVALEESLSYEDILMYRSLCQALLQREAMGLPVSTTASLRPSSPLNVDDASSAKRRSAASPIPQASSSYLGWIAGWAYSTSQQTEAGVDESSQNSNNDTDKSVGEAEKGEDDRGGESNFRVGERMLSAGILRELYAAVDQDSSSETSSSSAVVLPQEYVRRKIVFVLGQGAVKLIETSGRVLSTMIFSQVECRLDSCSDSHAFSSSLMSMQLFHDTVPILSSVESAGSEPILTARIEINAPKSVRERHAYSLHLHIRPLAFLFSRPFTEGIVHFFVRSKGTAWRDIQDFTGAAAQMDALQRQATNQLREVVDHRRSVYVSIQVDAPQLFVPEDVSKPNCSVLTVQMASLAVDTVVQERLEASLVTQDLVDQNPDLFYDRFTLKLARVHLSLTRPLDAWRWDAFAASCGKSTSLIDPCGLEFSLQRCLIDVPFLPSIKLATSVPHVRAYLSAAHFLSFVTCLRTVVSDDADDLAVDPASVGQSAIVPFSEEEILSLAEPHALVLDKEQARKLQVSFRVEDAAIFLHHDKTQSDLAELRFADFNISVAKLPKEMHFAIFLHDLQLVDLKKPADSPLRFLMRSAPGDCEDEKNNHLVTVRFAGVHRDAAAFDGVDYDLDLHMKQMVCVCNRDTVASLIDFGNDILDGLAATAPTREPSSLTLASASSSSSPAIASVASSPKGTAGLFLKVRFRMDSLKIQFALEREDTPFAEAHILSWDQVMRFRNDDTWLLDIRVGSTVLVDLRSVAQRWSNVLQLSGKETLHFSFETFLCATERPLDCHPGHISRGHNMLLSFRIESMRYVYVQNFVTEWVKYFVEIHSMQQMVAASYARAAGLAVNTAVLEQLLCYKVVLHNPVIVVPRSYESEGFVLLDLGTVVIQNLHCRDMKRVLFDRTEYSMDKMHVALCVSTLGNAKLLSDLTVRLEKEELEDYEMLSHEMPETRWNVTCSPIKVELSQEQAEFMFATVRENLVADSQKEETRTAYKDFQFTPLILPVVEDAGAERRRSSSASLPRVQKAASSSLPSSSKPANDAPAPSVPSPVVSAPSLANPRATRVILLNLERIEIVLLEGSGVVAGTTRPSGMVNFDMNNIVIQMTTDESGYSLSEFDMESVNLFDVRHRMVNQYSRMLSSNKASTSKQELHLTQVSYANGDKEFMLSVNHPRIILTPWAYRELWGFIWPLFESALASWDLWVSEGEKAPVVPNPAAADWTFRVTVTDPEIVIVTDATTHVCEALVLKGAVLFKHYEPAKGGQIRSIHFRQFEAFRCLLADQSDSVVENATTVSMVEPTDITVFHEWMPHKLREKWTVEIEPMNFTVSYHDFQMLAKLYRYWWPVEEEAAAAAAAELVTELVPFILEEVVGGAAEVAQDDAVLAARSVSVPSSLSSVAENDAAPVVQTVYKLSTQGTLLRIVNDFYAGNVPIALVSLPSLVVRVSQTEDALKLFASVTLLAEVYNDEVQAWEPVIEPYSAEVAYSFSDSAGIRASITAETVLDVNVTEASVDMLMRTWRDWSADFNKSANSSLTNSVVSGMGGGGGLETFRQLGALFVVRNDTGTPVWIWRVDEEGVVIEAPIHGYEVPLPEAKTRQPLLYQSRYRSLEKRTPASICIKVAGDLRVARDYPIHDVGSHILRVDPEDRIKLVLQISNQKGGKLLQVRTNVRFCNATDTALELEGHTAHLGSITMTVLQPGATFALPLAFLRSGRVRIRPAGKPYEWSSQSIYVSTIKRTSALMLCPPCEKKIQRADFAIFCVMDPSVEDPGALLVPGEEEHAVTLCAPVLLENLLGVSCVFRLIRSESDKVLMQGQLGKGEIARINLDVRQRLMLSVRLPDYKWSAPRGILGARAANSIEIRDSTGLPLTLDLHYVKFASGLTKVSVFTQFWVVNSTGVPLVHSQYSMQSRIVVAGQMGTIRVIQGEETATDVPASTDDLAKSEKGKEDAIEMPPKRIVSVMDRSSRYAAELFRPLMYFPEKAGKKMSFRGSFTHWSEPFTVGAAGTWEVVDLPQVKRKPVPGSKESIPRGLYQFVVSVEREPGKFWRTRTVSIKPRIMLINHTKTALLFAQSGVVSQATRLEVDEQVPFHWSSVKRDKLLSVRFCEGDWNWSPGFPLLANHKTTIKARNEQGQSALLKVRVLENENTLLVVLDEENTEFPTYRIHNASSEPVQIHQYLAMPHIFETVPAGASVAYAWDDPQIVPLLLEVVSVKDGEKILLDLDNLGLFNTSDPTSLLRLNPLEGLGHFYGVVTAEGPSKVATIKLNDSAEPLGKRRRDAAQLRKQKFAAHVSLRGIGISVVNRVPLELVYISMSDINLDYEDNKREQNFEFSIGHLQVDNQSFLTHFPVLLWTRPKRDKFLEVSLTRSADYASVHFIKRLSLFVDDMDVCMDDSVFLKLWDFVANVARSFDGAEEDDSSAAAASFVTAVESLPFGSVGASTPHYVIPTHNLKTRQIYLQEMTLSGTNLLVSFINTDDTADGQLGETAVSRIIRTYGALANIERAPVKLEPLTLTLQFLSRGDLTDTLKTHYVTGVRRGLAKILASADFLGAPMALAGHVREGARDLVEMPRKGAAADGARGAIAGVGKGTASLAKSVGYGAFNSLHKITGTIGDGVSALALDENYERERAKLARNRPEHAGQGLAYGARDAGLGLFRGISGVVTEPVRGAREDGVRGFFIGISRGITGLYVKPAVGVVDLVTRSAEGLKNTTTYWEEGSKKRVRLPRFIGAEGVMQVFQKNKAEGQWLLYSLASGKHFIEHREFYKAHFATGVKTTLLVTDESIIHATENREDFRIRISSIERIAIDNAVFADGIIVVMIKAEGGGVRKIPCVFNNQNFSKELLKLLTGLLRHEVESLGKPSSSPKAPRRRSVPKVDRGRYDQFMSSEDEEPTLLDASPSSSSLFGVDGGGLQDNNNNV